MSDNISLSIKSGKSLSYAIDKQLDSELGVDVKLNITEWNSVFAKIKENQVETNKNQFTDKDTDIRNGKHYVVDANSTYEIKKEVWAEIVKIAQKRFGAKQTVKENTDIQETPTEVKEKTSGNKEHVTTVLQKNKIATDDLDIADIVKKYDTLKSIYPNMSQDELDQRTAEYATGKLYEKTLDKFDKIMKDYVDQEASPENSKLSYNELLEKYKAQLLEHNSVGFTIKGVHEAMEYGKAHPTEEGYKKALKMQKEGYHSFGRSLISTFDTNNDFKVDEKEFITHMLERHPNDKNKTAMYKETFEFIDKNKNGIEEDEMTAYAYALSKAEDSHFGTTTGDFVSFLDAGYASNAMEYKTNGPKTEREENTVDHFKALYDLGYKQLND